MAELPGAMAPPSSVGVCVVLGSTGLLCVPILDEGGICSLQGHFFLTVEILLTKITPGKETPLDPDGYHFTSCALDCEHKSKHLCWLHPSSLCLSLHPGSVCGFLPAVTGTDSEPHRPLSPQLPAVIEELCVCSG